MVGWGKIHQCSFHRPVVVAVVVVVVDAVDVVAVADVVAVEAP